MNSFQRLRVLRRNTNCGSAFNFFKVVSDFSLQLLHCRNAWWNLVVYKHRCIEIALGEHVGNVLEMHSNLVAALNVVSGIRCDHYGATGLAQ